LGQAWLIDQKAAFGHHNHLILKIAYRPLGRYFTDHHRDGRDRCKQIALLRPHGAE
jgi:hypothetical protein